MRIINRLVGWAFSKTLKKQVSSEAQAIANRGIQKIKAQLGYGYQGGAYYQGGTGGSKWPCGLSASGGGIVLNHRLLRRNARSAYHDTPQVKAIVDRFADTVADIGLMLEPTPKIDVLGVDMETAERWAVQVGDSFDSWARAKNQHRAGNMSFYQSHRLYQIFQQRDNDIFTRLYYSQDRNLLNPLQFGFIDPDQIRGDAFTSTFGYQVKEDGIKRDSQGREISYKVWIEKPGKPREFDYKTIPAIGPKSKRLFMLHGFVPEYAGQGRGYSRLAHTLQEFENLTDFTLAQVKKAINQSNITMYVKPSLNAPSSQPFEGILTNRGAGPAAEQFGANPTPAAEALNVPNVSYSPLPEATIDTPGSVIIASLEGGEELKPGPANAPSDSFDTFVDAFTGYLAASMSMPLEIVLMKFNKNYSASRAALLLFWRVAQIWREEMATDFLNPIYHMWLAGEIAAGRILAPGWSDPRLRAAWLNARWIGAPMPNIDPMKTAKADQLYVEMGAQTLERVARNFNGSSSRNNRTKLAREFSELPIPYWKQKGGSKK